MKTGYLQRSVGIVGRSDPLMHLLGAASIAEDYPRYENVSVTLS